MALTGVPTSLYSTVCCVRCSCCCWCQCDCTSGIKAFCFFVSSFRENVLMPHMTHSPWQSSVGIWVIEYSFIILPCLVISDSVCCTLFFPFSQPYQFLTNIWPPYFIGRTTNVTRIHFISANLGPHNTTLLYFKRIENWKGTQETLLRLEWTKL